jgi:hypothetical protein
MAQTFAIIDTAREDRLYELVATAEHVCLFAGDLDPVMRRASPYLAVLKSDGRLARAWDKEGLGESWGIRCTSTADLKYLSRHFRHFLQAKLPDGKVVLFRFYDPRVWRAYLPTCNPFELRQWFRNVDSFEAEASDGKRLRYLLDGETLSTSVLK